MKIAILTQPLKQNYGGLLQAWALQKVLQELGHSVITIDINHKRANFILKIAVLIKRLLLFIIFREKKYLEFPHYLKSKEREYIFFYPNSFIKENINKTFKIYTSYSLKKIVKKEKFDAYIVGSDQVWRPLYSPRILTYYLDFLPNKNKSKRISYAASFGVDNFEYSDKLRKKCSYLLKSFDGVSVREDSAVEICRNYFNTKSVQVLDPTMLLKKEDYIALINKKTINNDMKGIFTYILDRSLIKNEIIKTVSNILDTETFEIMPNKDLSKIVKGANLVNFQYKSVEEWLYSFKISKYVITDSFHGSVFAIIFNVPFLSIANTQRGEDRFLSLFRLFNLENRLVRNIYEINETLLNEKIDWSRVNLKREQLMDKSFSFLINNLEHGKL